MYMVSVDAEKCVGCGACAGACPGSVYTIEDGKAVVGDNECLGCQSCVLICPNEAITLSEF